MTYIFDEKCCSRIKYAWNLILAVHRGGSVQFLQIWQCLQVNGKSKEEYFINPHLGDWHGSFMHNWSVQILITSHQQTWVKAWQWCCRPLRHELQQKSPFYLQSLACSFIQHRCFWCLSLLIWERFPAVSTYIRCKVQFGHLSQYDPKSKSVMLGLAYHSLPHLKRWTGAGYQA